MKILHPENELFSSDFLLDFFHFLVIMNYSLRSFSFTSFGVYFAWLQVYMLMGIYAGCSVLALVVIITLLDQVPHRMNRTQQGSKASLFVETFRHMRHRNQLLIIPLTIYSGMEHGFLDGDFTKVSAQALKRSI